MQKSQGTTTKRGRFARILAATVAAFATMSNSQKNQSAKNDATARYVYGKYENPIYIPSKHTKMSYRAQQRAAKRRKK